MCNVCQECNVSIENGQFCNLCKPYMKLEESMKTLTFICDESLAVRFFETEEVIVRDPVDYINAVAQEETYTLSEEGCLWDMVAEELMLHGTTTPYDKVTGQELFVDRKINDAPLADLYDVSEETELAADQDAGYVSDSSLCIYAEADYEEMYEPGFSEQMEAAMKEPVLSSASEFITKEQAETNFWFYISKVHNANSLKELAIVRNLVISFQTSKRADAASFFPVAGSKVFWDFYKERKEELLAVLDKQRQDSLKASEQALVEICGLIVSHDSIGMLRRINSEIYKAYLPKAIKAKLYDKVRAKIEGQEVQINIKNAIDAFYYEVEAARNAKRNVA